jgi:integrase
LAVLHSKHGKSRRIPLHPTTVTALGRYAAARDREVQCETTTFFVTADGRRLDSHDVASTFAKLLLATASINPLAGQRPARLGDLRHSFAVSTLLSWHRSGADVQSRLPALSAYLGHNDPHATYWYLEAVPELMALAAHRLERSWQARP